MSATNQANDLQLRKARTGIEGFDEVTGGGLPAGRPTLICGSAGCGKTLFAMEFLVRGAIDFGEPGVFVAFEETEDDLIKNVRSLGFDLNELVEKQLLVIDHIRIERSEIEEAGEFDLEGLFVRLGLAIDSIGAKRVVLDTLEALFSGFTNHAILRAELRRLFMWLKERGVTAVITAERGDGHLTRQGLEEYVSDCVILLDHRVSDQLSTRRLRIVKYRGSSHGTNEYPFLIDADGISVIPITSLRLEFSAPNEFVSTGSSEIDAMLGGKGFYRNSTVLISGTAGTGKTSLASSVIAAACARSEQCIYFSFEESPDQIVRNMKSIGVDLAPHVASGRLQCISNRPSFYGLEMHLAMMHRIINKEKPKVVVIDPITSLLTGGTGEETTAMLVRMIDFLRSEGVTALLTSLSGAVELEATEVGVSSIVDTWILLRDIESGGERNRGIYILKSRGMAHSNQIREYLLTDEGIKLQDVCVTAEGVLTGSMRAIHEARERSALAELERARARELRAAERVRRSIEAQIRDLQEQLTESQADAAKAVDEEVRERRETADDRHRLLVSRKTATNGDEREPTYADNVK
jgi:circadian clock protein KaiC